MRPLKEIALYPNLIGSVYIAKGLPPLDTVYKNTANYVSFYRALNYKHKAKPRTRFHHDILLIGLTKELCLNFQPINIGIIQN